MARSATDYLRLLQSLLPWGKLWPRDPSATLTQFLAAEAEELARIDNRSNDLLIERNTLTTTELITDHEVELGLPDECTRDYNLTLIERRLAVNTKLTAVGQQNKEYFIGIASSYGFTASIIEYTPFWCDLGVSGDPCGDQTNLFYWRLKVLSSDEIIYFLSGTGVSGDTLEKISDLLNTVFCFANKYKPGHSFLISEVVGAGFDSGFDFGFESLPDQDPVGGFTRGFATGFDIYFS